MRHYVYRHIRLDKNEPFYIGIGSDKYYKRAKTRTKRNPIWKRIAEKTEIEIQILFDDLILQDAKEKEIEFIKLYGRINCGNGTLANITGGGDGMFDPPKSLRERYSKKFSGSGNPFYGKKHTEETRKKLIEANKRRPRVPLSEETKRKIGLANRGNSPPLKGKKDPKGSASRTGVNHHTYKGKINCFNLIYDLVATFDCLNDAVVYFKANNSNDIARVVRGERKTFKKHIFKYEWDVEWRKSPFYQTPIIYIDNKPKMVIDTNSGIIYKTIKEASEKTGIPHRNLARYLTGERENKTTFQYYNQKKSYAK